MPDTFGQVVIWHKVCYTICNDACVNKWDGAKRPGERFDASFGVLGCVPPPVRPVVGPRAETPAIGEALCEAATQQVQDCKPHDAGVRRTR